jgi:hypothetical protein
MEAVHGQCSGGVAKIVQANRSYASRRKKPPEFDLDLSLSQGLSTCMENQVMLPLALVAGII